MQQEPILNEHNKEEFPPAHTAEHLLNQLMIRLFGTQRSNNAHVERKKSKITYKLDHKPTRKEEKEIETEMNRLIALDMPVSYEFTDRDTCPRASMPTACRPMPLRPSAWCASATMTSAPASASTCGPRRR